jgi:pyridoxine kinase
LKFSPRDSLTEIDVGNKAAVFPLQLLGFDVDVVNSVHFSNHTGYKNGFEGDVLKGTQLRAIMTGLKRNGLLSEIGHVLTGYIGSESFLEAVLDVIKMVREEVGNSTSKNFRFVCDPVLGDKGKFYVPVELVQLYREKVIPLADVLTPNQFEAEQLTGIPIRSIGDAIRACRELHKMGPSLIFVTSMELESNPNRNSITIMASELQRVSHECTSEQIESAWTIDCPILPGHFTGTGDLCAALFLAHSAIQQRNTTFTSISISENNAIPDAMERVINTMFAVLQRTLERPGTNVKSCELRLIQSQDIILNPPRRFKAQKIV